MMYKETRRTLEQMVNENYEDFIKALISIEKAINDENTLDTLYQKYMENDDMSLLNDEFESYINELI